MRLRGLIWIGIGIALYFGGMAVGHPLLLRFTQVPLGWVIVGIGVLYVGYDLWKQRRRPPEDGGKL